MLIMIAPKFSNPQFLVVMAAPKGAQVTRPLGKLGAVHAIVATITKVRGHKAWHHLMEAAGLPLGRKKSVKEEDVRSGHMGALECSVNRGNSRYLYGPSLSYSVDGLDRMHCRDNLIGLCGLDVVCNTIC